ncbi:MAG: rhombosortase [Gammaproteobacteria bacterium]
MITNRLTLSLLLFVLLFAIVQLLQQSGFDLRLLSTTLHDHAWYRLVTGHLVHTNWPHMLMNSAALLITLLLFPVVYGKARLLGSCVLWNMLFISFGILLLFPQIGWYAGFSGVVHGLLMTGALLSLREPVSKLLLVLLVAKVGWELWSGGDSVSTELIDAPVIYEAHLLGLMAGALAALPLQLLSMVRESRISAP